MEPSAIRPASFMARVSSFLCSHSWQILVLVLAMRILAAATLPVSYKEAYFWEWARFFSLGYLDHPPLVAWIIKTFTLLLPDHWLLTVRGGGLLFGAGTAVLVYGVAWQMFGDRVVAARAMILAASVPLLNAVGFLMLPDGPMVFFHLLALSCYVSAVRSERILDWCLLGVALGLALLSKLMAVLPVLGLALFLVCSREHRSWLKRKGPYLALAVALAVLSPFLYWNLTHDWASFVLQLRDRHYATFGFGFGRIAEFVGEQLADTLFLSGPLLVSICAGTTWLPGPWRSWYRLLQWQSTTTLLFFLMTGAVTETHPHWTVLAYPPAVIALAAYWKCQPEGRVARSLNWLVPLSLGFVFIVLSLMPFARSIMMSISTESLNRAWAAKVATARVRLFGWPDLVAQIEARLRRVSDATDGCDGTIFTDSYKQAALLSFYRESGLVINVDIRSRGPRRIGDGGWFYLPAERVKCASGIFLTTSKTISVEELSRVFRYVVPIAGFPQGAGDEVIAWYSAFRVEGFLGSGMR
mgnify:FL=1